MRRFVSPIVIEKDKDGYFVFCPALRAIIHRVIPTTKL
jgi:hypothetical protein